MSFSGHVGALGREARSRAVRWILAHRIRARHPTLFCDPTAIWDYGYHDIDAISIGQNVSVGAFVEILMHRRNPRSSVEGRLVLEDGAILTTGVNIRAAGGMIRVGEASGIAQYSVVIAANHVITPGVDRLQAAWDEHRTGVELGRNVWVGALCVLLPGTRIGDGSIVGAGSVVRGVIPPNEFWAGVPARKIKDLGEALPPPPGP